MSVGICFSGGGIKGAFHIGVLRAFEEAGINIDFVSGTSSGAIIASLHAAGFSSSDILNLFNFYAKKIVAFDNKTILKSFLNVNKGARCINKFDNAERILYSVFKSKGIFDINDLKKKIAICCTDVNLGKSVYFINMDILSEDNIYMCDGILAKIVRASMAYPVLFEPSWYKNRVLVDGGVINNLPVGVLKNMGADKLVAVDVSNSIVPLKNMSFLSVGLRCIDIMGKYTTIDEVKKADLVIRPNNVCNIGMFDFEYINVLVNEGYYTAKKAILKF